MFSHVCTDGMFSQFTKLGRFCSHVDWDNVHWEPVYFSAALACEEETLCLYQNLYRFGKIFFLVRAKERFWYQPFGGLRSSSTNLLMGSDPPVQTFLRAKVLRYRPFGGPQKVCTGGPQPIKRLVLEALTKKKILPCFDKQEVVLGL